MQSAVLSQITNRGIPDLSRRFSGTGSGVAFLGALLRLTISIIFIVGSLYFLFQLLTGGVAWIGSGGDKGKLDEARSKLFNAGIGLVLLFSGFAIITLIQNVFGVSLLMFNIPTL